MRCPSRYAIGVLAITIAAETGGAQSVPPLTIKPGRIPANESTQITINGTVATATNPRGVNPANVRLSISGPGCAPACGVDHKDLMVSAVTAGRVSVTAKAALNVGRFTITVANDAIAIGTVALDAAPRITKVWWDPIVPTKPFTFAVLGGFDAAAANATIAGPGCPQAGCEVTRGPAVVGADGRSSGSVFIGKAVVPGPGRYTLTLTQAFVASDGFALDVAAPQIRSVHTSPDPPMPGQRFTFDIAGDGFFDSERVVATIGAGCPALCPATVDRTAPITTSFLSGAATLPDSGIYRLTVGRSAQRPGVDIVVPPYVASFVTTPSAPVAGQAFDIKITGSGLANTQLLLFDGAPCRGGCQLPGNWIQRTPTGVAFRALIRVAGRYEVRVDKPGPRPARSSPQSLAIGGGRG